VSESAEILARLTAAGQNYRQIGDALGRNRSYFSQVARGVKPGNDDLRDALAALERRLAGSTEPIVEPRRRATAAGARAKVRRRTDGRAWSSASVKQSAARSGARSLGKVAADAAHDGRQLAVTVSVDKTVSVQKYGTHRRGVEGPGGSADFKLGPADEEHERLVEEFGGNVTAYVAARMLEEGLAASTKGGPLTPATLAAHIVDLELRTFD
jgi:hypothetical protein